MFTTESNQEQEILYIREEVSGEMNDEKKLGMLVSGERALQAEGAPSIKALRWK